MHPCRLSIIVPVFNAAPYIKRCTESILQQDYKDYELILVNDGSKDESGEICDEIAQTNNQTFVLHQENKGVNAARLSGIQNSSGIYLMFVDADDMLAPQAISILMNEIENGYDIVKGTHNIFDKNGIIREGEAYTITNKEFQTGEAFAIALHRGDIAPYLWGGIYKKSLIEEEFFRRLIEYNITIGEDYVLNLFISRNASRIKLVPKIVYLYFSNDTSVMHTRIMGRNYAHRVDLCLTDYVNSSNSEIQSLFKLNQVRGAISRDFQKEIPFSMSDYRFVLNYIQDKDKKKELYASLPKRFWIFLPCLPLYFLYSRCFGLYRWAKRGFRNREVI